jgi:hypothetical protein
MVARRGRPIGYRTSYEFADWGSMNSQDGILHRFVAAFVAGGKDSLREVKDGNNGSHCAQSVPTLFDSTNLTSSITSCFQ